ncbi:MAG: SpoIIE family protein phosphatase [Candidatus Aegiribacteria sp.]
MSRSELEQVLEVVYKAILRETASFNYYYRAGSDHSLPEGVRGLLAKLAEEERGHRKILISEYTAIQKGWGGTGPGDRGKGSVSYRIPQKLDFLPLTAPECMDFSAVSLPARLVGGDYILTRVVGGPGGDEIGMFMTLYDAMGHSLETTGINSAAAGILGEYLDTTASEDVEREILSPSRAVTHLNGEFSGSFQGTGVFLTLFSGYFDVQNGTLTYTIAGHEPPMLIRSDGKLESLFNTQLIVGIDDQHRYSESTVPFSPGDTLCLFSDGILEAQDTEGRFYGRRRLKDALSGLHGRPAEEVVAGILDDLREFCDGESMHDELTLAVVGCRKGKR